VDIWAAACLLSELVTGEPLFDGDEEREVARAMITRLGPAPATLTLTTWADLLKPADPGVRQLRQLLVCMLR
jgi:hypothetical protein